MKDARELAVAVGNAFVFVVEGLNNFTQNKKRSVDITAFCHSNARVVGSPVVFTASQIDEMQLANDHFGYGIDFKIRDLRSKVEKEIRCIDESNTKKTLMVNTACDLLDEAFSLVAAVVRFLQPFS